MALGGLDATEVRVAQSGKVSFGSIGAAAPTDVTTALTSAWTEAGYIDEDGVSISPDVSINEIRKWQAMLPVLVTVEEVSLEVSFVMNQFNKANTGLYLFGNTWTNQAAGVAKLTASSSPSMANFERAMVIEFTDNKDKITRFYFPRGIVIEREELTLNRTEDIKLGLTYHVLDNSGEMFQVFSNNEDIYT
jgi:hypothetical protein